MDFSSLGLTPEQSQLLIAQFTEKKSLIKEKFFIKPGQTCHEIGIITKGKCRYFYKNGREEVTRWVSLQGDFLTSLTSFIQQQPALEYIKAMETTEIIIMPHANWNKLYHEQEFFRELWRRQIEQNYIGMEERVFNLIAKSAEKRYEWMQKHQPRFIREVPDKYLASMLGMQPRHLSRIRAKRK